MFWTKMKIAAAVLMSVGVASGAGFVGHQALSPRNQEAVVVAEPVDDVSFENFDLLALLDNQADNEQADNEQGEKKPGKPTEKPDLAGIVKTVSDDGKTITLAMPPKNKGEAPETVVIKLTDATKISYFGVESEKPTAGYMAAVWFQEGSKDLAAKVLLGQKQGAGKEDKPDLFGKLTAIAGDQKSITIESSNKKEGTSEKHEIKLTANTKVIFTNVDDGVTTPEVGFQVRVFLEPGSKDTAKGVAYSGNKKGNKPEQPNPNNKPKPEQPNPNNKPKPEKPDANAKPKPENVDPNNKPKPENVDPNNKPKPEKADPNAKPKPEQPDPNAKPKPENVDPNNKPKPEKPDADAKKETTRTLILSVGATQVLQMSNKQPIKEVFNEKDTVARVSTVPNDPTRILVTGLTTGFTRITLVGADGSKEVFVPKSK